MAFRTVFVMREVEEMSVEETAACLSIPAATVRTRLFRARGLLREALARDMDKATSDVFDFAGARCDRIVAGVLSRIGSVRPWPDQVRLKADTTDPSAGTQARARASNGHPERGNRRLRHQH